METDINHGSMEEIAVIDHDRLKKGKRVLYEGKEAKIIEINPTLVIKIKNRVICGALHSRIEFIEECST